MIKNPVRAYTNAREAFRAFNTARKNRKARKQAKREAKEQGIPFVDTQEDRSMFPKGSQTLTGIAILALTPLAAQAGFTSEQVTLWVTAASTVVGGLIAVLGYLRRKKMPAE